MDDKGPNWPVKLLSSWRHSYGGRVEVRLVRVPGWASGSVGNKPEIRIGICSSDLGSALLFQSLPPFSHPRSSNGILERALLSQGCSFVPVPAQSLIFPCSLSFPIVSKNYLPRGLIVRFN